MGDASALGIARLELILGGQKSGKSRRAESLAQAWLAQDCSHKVVFVVTATAGDDEIAMRIARHQTDRAKRLPGIVTVEAPVALAAAMIEHSHPDTLVVVDCLTLWLTNLLMPMNCEQNRAQARVQQAQPAMFLGAIAAAPGPLVVVSNEIGLGVIPLGEQVRAYVDALGNLNQQVAQRATRVTLMAAGLPLQLKNQP